MSDRLRHLVYRCYRCARPLSKLEILKTWEDAEASGKLIMGLCPCGSRHINPSNLTPEEEEVFLSKEQQDRYDSGVRDHKTRFVELWHKEVDGKSLDPEIYPTA